ncbi:MAG TPA: alpha/beta hydrolase [Isosphaeraceae bacterium]|nr:alpha/beta hydrolase [Isosphaeraceae bacterium]
MRIRRKQGAWSALVMATAALATVSIALAQGPNAKTGSGKGKADKTAKGGLRVPGGAPPKKFARSAVDPFAAPGAVAAKGAGAGAGALPLPPVWPFHYRFKITSFDGTPLAAVYYPAQRTNAPVLMLIHEKGRLGKDFEDSISDLKDKGLAEYLQSQGYAVLELDLRGHGSNARKEIGPRDGILMVRDLQAAYEFLVDRHNREELNLAKFGVVAVGEGANLAAAWAATPGGAVSSEGRISDLGALVCVSPVAEGFGFSLARTLPVIAPRLPMLLLAGELDHASLDPVKEAQPIVSRPPQRQSKVEFFPTPLHGYKLLRFQSKVGDSVVAFFDSTIKKLRLEEWEPRFILTPVAFGEIELVTGKKVGPAKAEEKKVAEPEKKGEEKKAEEKAKAEEAEKKAEEKKTEEKKTDESAKKQSKPSTDTKASKPTTPEEKAKEDKDKASK